jgi:hypothetical protein
MSQQTDLVVKARAVMPREGFAPANARRCELLNREMEALFGQM